MTAHCLPDNIRNTIRKKTLVLLYFTTNIPLQALLLQITFRQKHHFTAHARTLASHQISTKLWASAAKLFLEILVQNGRRLAAWTFRLFRQLHRVYNIILCTLLPVRKECRGGGRRMFSMRLGVSGTPSWSVRHHQNQGQNSGDEGDRRKLSGRSADVVLLSAMCLGPRGSGSARYGPGWDSHGPWMRSDLYLLRTQVVTSQIYAKLYV